MNNKNPVLLDSYLKSTTEIDVDAISDGVKITILGIMQHVEEAGVHSGDSACSLPPYSLEEETITEIKRQTKVIATELKVLGLLNIQFAVNDSGIYVLEANPRASRTLPFVSKAIGSPLPGHAALMIAGLKTNNLEEINPSFFSVKEVVLPFDKFPGTDILLGPEMKSTGEVMGIGMSFDRAFLKAQIAAGVNLPSKGFAFVSVRDGDKSSVLIETCSTLIDLGIKIIATEGTASYLSRFNIEAVTVNKAHELRPNILDLLVDNKINIVFNTTEGTQSIKDSREIRSLTITKRLPYSTSLAGAWAVALAMKSAQNKKTEISSLQVLNKKYVSTDLEDI